MAEEIKLPYDELIAKLTEANKCFKEYVEARNKAKSFDEPAEGRKYYMEAYNKVIRAIDNIPDEVKRIVTTQKAELWRNKEYDIKNI